MSLGVRLSHNLAIVPPAVLLIAKRCYRDLAYTQRSFLGMRYHYKLPDHVARMTCVLKCHWLRDGSSTVTVIFGESARGFWPFHDSQTTCILRRGSFCGHTCEKASLSHTSLAAHTYPTRHSLSQPQRESDAMLGEVKVECAPTEASSAQQQQIRKPSQGMFAKFRSTSR